MNTQSPLYVEALRKFTNLLELANGTDLIEPSAMSLATADAEGNPSVRTVLAKHVDERGVVFYSNQQSRKGKQLAARPRASVCFYWQPLMQQVLIEGNVEVVSEQESDQYWRSRPRVSQIGAWASKQSEVLVSPDVLVKEVEVYEHQFQGKEVPRPDHWSGYRIIPDSFEFWSSKPGRLHERFRYRKQGDDWVKEWLNP